MPDPIIQLKGVSKSFGKLRVIEDLSLDIQRGQTTVIIGPSGTGKSVLLKLMVLLLRPDKGEVWFDGQRIDQFSEAQLVPIRTKFGFLFQMGALFDSMDVQENICFPLLEHSRITAAQRHERCARVLKMVGLDGIQHKMPAELSGGQRKRVALARAVVLEPAVVMYDEPTTGLDPIRADVINELIISLAKTLEITSIAVTHDMASADKIGDRMVMLNEGKIEYDADPKGFHETDNEFVQRFIKGQAEEEELQRIREGFGETVGKAGP